MYWQVGSFCFTCAHLETFTGAQSANSAFWNCKSSLNAHRLSCHHVLSNTAHFQDKIWLLVTILHHFVRVHSSSEFVLLFKFCELWSICGANSTKQRRVWLFPFEVSKRTDSKYNIFMFFFSSSNSQQLTQKSWFQQILEFAWSKCVSLPKLFEKSAAPAHVWPSELLKDSTFGCYHGITSPGLQSALWSHLYLHILLPIFTEINTWSVLVCFRLG